MNDKEKKRTLIGLSILGLLVLVGLSITSLTLLINDFSAKDLIDWFLSNFGITGLSIYLKLLVNKKHEKKISAIVKGEDMFKKEEIKLYNGFRITINKDNEINVKDTLNRSKLEVLKFTPKAISEFVQEQLNSI